MIEYLYNAVRATAGEEINISAIITDNSGASVTENCGITFYGDEKTTAISGIYYEDLKQWAFIIPADITEGLNGRYFYTIWQGGKDLCFKQPLYLM